MGCTGSAAVGAGGLVLDRVTGNIVEEPMPESSRKKLHLLHRSCWGGCVVNSSALRNYLYDDTKRVGEMYDSADSKEDIWKFVEMYQVDITNIELGIDEYHTMNQFFYRRLRKGARPIAEGPMAVQPADCRLHVFNTVDEATSLYIKGKNFSLESLLGPDRASMYQGGGLAIHRLAPQDYHRFHSPVSGIVGESVAIDGDYYTVKPLSIKTKLNVLGKNKRVVLYLYSKEYGPVCFVMVGAVHVGSINLTVTEGDVVQKGDELGYFAYGGSTIVTVYRPGMIQFDEDLVLNSKNGCETLVKMGEPLGTTPANAVELEERSMPRCRSAEVTRPAWSPE
eukprot:Sspe_Gene.78514::Locus_49108_Transcript_1_1_Confidence_1.000_Length_1054::g.78514::m.78514/K01613/psd, PISD; phosphatidylserine decarboxylase